MEYTVEVYKRDARKKSGERLLHKTDMRPASREDLERTLDLVWGSKPGHRYEIHETYVTRTNMMGGAEYQERYDTPRYCSPSSEAYWSM